MPVPPVLVVAPPPIGEPKGTDRAEVRGRGHDVRRRGRGVSRGRRRRSAAPSSTPAAVVPASRVDGVHLDADRARALGGCARRRRAPADRLRRHVEDGARVLRRRRRDAVPRSRRDRALVWREALIAGPLGAPPGSARWLEERATFLAGYAGVAPEVCHRRLVRQQHELAAAMDADEVVLWFARDLFCELSLLYVLTTIATGGAAAVPAAARAARRIGDARVPLLWCVVAGGAAWSPGRPPRDRRRRARSGARRWEAVVGAVARAPRCSRFRRTAGSPTLRRSSAPGSPRSATGSVLRSGRR